MNEKSEGISEMKNWWYISILVIHFRVTSYPKTEWPKTVNNYNLKVSVDHESEHILAGCPRFKLSYKVEEQSCGLLSRLY